MKKIASILSENNQFYNFSLEEKTFTLGPMFEPSIFKKDYWFSEEQSRFWEFLAF